MGTLHKRLVHPARNMHVVNPGFIMLSTYAVAGALLVWALTANAHPHPFNEYLASLAQGADDLASKIKDLPLDEAIDKAQRLVADLEKRKSDSLDDIDEFKSLAASYGEQKSEELVDWLNRH